MNGCDMGSTQAIGWELAGCTVGRDTSTDSFSVSTPVFTGRRYQRHTWGSSSEWRVDFGTGKFTGDTIWGGFWWKTNSLRNQTAGNIFGIHRGGSTWISGGTHSAAFSVFSIQWMGQYSNIYQCHDANNSAVGDKFTMYEGVWHFISFEVSATGTGNLTLKVDGKVVCNNVASDYAGTSATGDQYSIALTPRCTHEFDDWIFGDGAGTVNNAIPEPHFIQPIWPDADSSNTGYTTLLPTTPVDRYSKINEQGSQDDDTSYCDTAAVSDEYTVTLGNLVTSPITGGVLAYHQVQRARRSSGVDTVTLRNRLKSGTTYYNGTDKVTGDAYENVNDFWELDPDTGPAAWDETGINQIRASGIMV